ncbi:MAG: hypothetical protein V1668_02295 [Patescibacteria group bacterium]
MKKFFYWAPRVLSILIVCFVSVFALDIFEGDKTAGEIALGLLIHLIPTFVGIAVIVIAWKRELIGGWLFMALAVAFLFMSRFELAGMLMIALPFAVIGGMFLVHYYKYRKPAATSSP